MDTTLIRGSVLALYILLCLKETQPQALVGITQPEAEGTFVVNSTLHRLSELTEVSDDLQPDNGFMRRIAWVETEDGTVSRAFSDSAYHGGIWRVDRPVYDATREMFDRPIHSALFENIKLIFGINWSQTDWEDCRKPLYSALAARLYFHNLRSAIPTGLKEQAEIWWNVYHSQPTDTVENFIRKVSALEGSFAEVCALNKEKTRGRGMDLTLVPGASGTPVVEASLQKLNRLMTGIDANAQQDGGFLADFRFMRRLAWVETRDGTAEFTYSDPGYHGGIWRVDRTYFETTLQMVGSQDYGAIFRAIEQIFCIDWGEITWEECRKPLYSALATRLYFHSQQPIIPPGVQDQGEYRDTHDKQPSGTVTDFVLNVTDLESSNGCRVRGIDLVFVLDSSGSVGTFNFEKMKNFVEGVVDFFDIGTDRTRVGVTQYSSRVTVEFNLNEYTNKTLLERAIRHITYTSGGTNTVEALEDMESMRFLEENGARPANEGLPRVAVVITDGQSQGAAAVAVPSDRAREKGITLFAIGVGNANGDELNAIANKPRETFVFHVDSFDAISNIDATLEDASCNRATPLTSPTINGTLDNDSTQYLQQTVTDEGITLAIEASDGSVVMYVSVTTPNPNVAFYDFYLEAVEGEETVEIFIGLENFDSSYTVATGGGPGSGNLRQKRAVVNQNDTSSGPPIGTVYMTIEGRLTTNDFMLTVTEGDVTKPPTKKPSLSGCGFVDTSCVAMMVISAVFTTRFITANL